MSRFLLKLQGPENEHEQIAEFHRVKTRNNLILALNYYSNAQ